MVAVQEVQQFLLRLAAGQPADPLGQGRRGVGSDNAQAHFQRRKAALGIGAGFLQRLVKAPPQVNGAEQGGDAAPIGALVVLARVVLAVALRVLGGVVGVLWLDVVEDGLNDQAATLVKELAKGSLEVEGGSGSDGGTEKARGQGGNLLGQVAAGPRRKGEAGLKVLNDNRSHNDGQNARLSHGGRLSRQGAGAAWSRGYATFVVVKPASFSRPPRMDLNTP
jgi:hypothetical protein